MSNQNHSTVVSVPPEMLSDQIYKLFAMSGAVMIMARLVEERVK